MSNAPDLPRPPGGRTSLWLGLGVALVGPVLYVAQLSAGRTDAPWYMPALATLGAVMVLSSWRRRPNVGRSLGLGLVAFLAAFEWWFLISYVRLPAYDGPVRAGAPFPEFHAVKADGTPFTRADLPGDRATALVFFRGRW